MAPTLDLDFVKQAFPDPRLKIEKNTAYDVLGWADVAMVASGTAMLETALEGTPFCLFYRLSSSNAWLYRNVARYRGYIGMPNVLLKKEAVREFFQETATVTNLYNECVKLITDEPYRAQQARELKACRELLGTTGASRRVAFSISDILRAIPLEGSDGLAPAPAIS